MAEDVAGGTADASPAMRAFLEQRRGEVLARAIATLETCERGALAGEAHRLAGTLGVYGFADASDALRQLQRSVESPEASDDTVSHERARTLELLRGSADDNAEKGPR